MTLYYTHCLPALVRVWLWRIPAGRWVNKLTLEKDARGGKPHPASSSQSPPCETHWLTAGSSAEQGSTQAADIDVHPIDVAAKCTVMLQVNI